MAKTAKQPAEKKTPAAKKPTTTKAPAAPAPAPKPEPKPAKAKVETKPKQETAKKYLPSKVALALDGKGKPAILVGKRRIEAHKGEILDRTERYWSQLGFLRIAKDKGGKLHLTTAREAAAKGLEIL